MKFNKKCTFFCIISIMLLFLTLYSCNNIKKKSTNMQSESTANSEITDSNTPENADISSELADGSNSAIGNENNSNLPNSSESKNTNSIPPPATPNVATPIPPLTKPNLKKLNNVRGVWVTTAWNIDFPSDNDIPVSKLKEEINSILKKCKELNLNTVFLQVRSESDAFYKSSIFPTSRFLVQKQGSPLLDNFDPLSYFIAQAHKQNIDVHAWINPYRASVTSITTLANSHPIRKNPALWLPVKCTGEDGCYSLYCPNQKMLFYDPALPEVTNLIVDGVMEIVNNYDIDGIHLDDYFYPDKQTFSYNDNQSYEKFGDGKSIEDFRRNNTYTLINTLNYNIKKSKKDVYFGVSPGGIWADKSSQAGGSDTINTYGSYDNVYADTRIWVKDKLLDYIAPQLYLSGDNPRASFDVLAKWWSDVVDDTGVSLLVGQASYKTKSGVENGFSISEIGRQIRLLKTLKNYNGNIQFSFSDLPRIQDELLNN